ncbi:flagellar biosynthesis repressor FlbT [Terasakiella sp. SH-1]|uniref:flagellar biosynthesis repressor FlbT n=1 Tax=Terasakiella sp. SH-1 TaxID=2560057 RepID=UPI0010738E43|nr:flagellar biosynthesis repressor FlbT [Terasakiella sp. SH-1]
MPLKINLKKGQKIILNGAVIENNSPRSVSFTLINEASILRDSDVMTAEEACTPASRIYFSLQGLYLFPEKRELYFQNLNDLLKDYESAAPSANSIIEEVREKIDNGDYYPALRKAREIIEHEGKILSNVQATITELRHGADRGESDAK